MKFFVFAFAMAVSFVSVTNASAAELSAQDKLRVTVQGICPVSGGKLGTMGTPIKVAIGEKKEEVFLCCKGCVKKKVNPKHWATIHANIFKAQQICPIMKESLPPKSKWTVVKGQVVYVCCPPCIEKVEKDPNASLKIVYEQYRKSLKKVKK